MINLFLDQNHWIYLSRAYHGNAHRPEHVEIAVELLNRVRSGHIRLPIQLTHLIELAGSALRGQRERFVEVLEYFSGLWFQRAWVDILDHEIRGAVRRYIGAPNEPSDFSMFGKGMLFAVAHNLSYQLTPLLEVRQRATCPGALYDWIQNTDESTLATLRARAYERANRYAAASERSRDNLRSETAEARRRAHAVLSLYEHQNRIDHALRELGGCLREMMDEGGPAQMLAFLEDIPTVHVDMELVLFRDRQWQHAVKGNEYLDLGYLATAVPYFDIVLVERFWHAGLQQTRLGEKYDTRVGRDLVELPGLAGW